MAKTRIARGGDETLRSQSFYGSAPARPAALRTIDAEGNSNVGFNKSLKMLNPQDITSKTSKHPKGKLPAKPKTAALLFAEDEFADHILAQSSSFPMLDVKKLKRQTQKVVLADSLTAWQDGKVSEAVIAKFVQKEADDKLRYEKEVELWNKEHPTDALEFHSNGIAVRAKTGDKEREEKQARQKAMKAIDKARKERRSGPVRTKEMVEIGKKAAARLKKKQKQKVHTIQYESLSEGSVSAHESEGPEASDSDADGDISNVDLSTDNEAITDNVQTDAAMEEENIEPTNQKHESDSSKPQSRKADAKTRPSKRDRKCKHETTSSKDATCVEKHAEPGLKRTYKSRRYTKSNEHGRRPVAAPKVCVHSKGGLEPQKHLQPTAGSEEDGGKRTKPKRGSKRLRQDRRQNDQEANMEDKSEGHPGLGPTKARKSRDLPGPLTNDQSVDVSSSGVGSKWKRSSNRRSQAAAEVPQSASRRRSADSSGDQGEYCGEFALDD